MAEILIATKCKMCQKCKLCQKDQWCQSTNYVRASIMQNCKKYFNLNYPKLLIMEDNKLCQKQIIMMPQ